jgi:hypothetical protein
VPLVGVLGYNVTPIQSCLGGADGSTLRIISDGFFAPARVEEDRPA